jgi:hypothetical protein
MFTTLWEKLLRRLASWIAREPVTLCHEAPMPHTYRAAPRWW